MILDISLGSVNIESLVFQIGAAGAGVVVLKQWIRSDIKKLESQRLEDKSSVHERISSLETSVEKLAGSVDTYVRTSTEERLRHIEQSYTREKAVELKVGALEVNVATMTNLLNRVAEQVNHLLIRMSSGENA